MELIQKAWNNFTYFFRRKYRQIQNIIRWIPILWNQFDFDYRYAIDVFKFQLKNLADFMDSDKSRTLDASVRAQRIRTVIKLIDKVYDEEYACEYQDKLKEKYGNSKFDFIPTGDTTYNDFTNKEEKLYEMVKVWNTKYSEDELKQIAEDESKMFNESQLKQEKAHRLLWKMIEHNIRGWWD